MTTEQRVSRHRVTLQCKHIAAGDQTAYVEWDHARYCLDCIAAMYEHNPLPQWEGIYHHVMGARQDKRRRK